jgi:hypothetical protein
MFLLFVVAIGALASADASPRDEAATAQVGTAPSAELDGTGFARVPQEALMVLAGTALLGIAAAVRRAA